MLKSNILLLLLLCSTPSLYTKESNDSQDNRRETSSQVTRDDKFNFGFPNSLALSNLQADNIIAQCLESRRINAETICTSKVVTDEICAPSFQSENMCATNLEAGSTCSMRTQTNEFCTLKAVIDRLCVRQAFLENMCVRNLRFCSPLNARVRLDNPVVYNLGDWLPFDTVVYDPHGHFDLTPITKYTVSEEATYVITLQLIFNDLTGPSIIAGIPKGSLQLYINGIQRRALDTPFLSFSTNSQPGLTTTIHLRAGDEITAKYEIFVQDPDEGEISYPGQITILGTPNDNDLSPTFLVSYLSHDCINMTECEDLCNDVECNLPCQVQCTPCQADETVCQPCNTCLPCVPCCQ